ncbi:hypothetical protein NL108_016016 [Boleophthalmus pectinirostris]|uniref:high choriolytic enzyme 1-like n=1 Tax=Boleophthalmus pectinirostris TaxID=150288 RepID=UPI00242F1419|nr:high choriolytic enzyme 1-like [Boleophthalmus pectinirostris]KAJ0060552.1 hypothetical protein NL108_016016 [Boleophthalmus pectinirostris]
MSLHSVSMLLLLLAACQAQPLSEPYSGQEQLLQDDTVDISTRILVSNNQSDAFFLEGDLLPPTHRNAMKCWYNSCLWPKGSDGLVTVPYTVSREFSSYETQVISSALRDFHSQTCIRFVPRQNQYDYITIENQSGCFSSLGRQRGRQVLSLNRMGCVDKGVIQHEFNHALGFKHEQTRSDRDQYVQINWENMDPSMAYNFYRSDTNNQGTPYDYGSIMHYGRTAFSNNGRDTITPLSNTQVYIGQRQALSPWDIKRINMLYSCTA